MAGCGLTFGLTLCGDDTLAHSQQYGFYFFRLLLLLARLIVRCLSRFNGEFRVISFADILAKKMGLQLDQLVGKQTKERYLTSCELAQRRHESSLECGHYHKA